MARLLLGLVFALSAAALSLPGRAQPAGTTWKVLVGADTPDHALQGQDFYPRTITINVGDTITWTKNVVLEHTVSFLSGAKPPLPFTPQPDQRVLVTPSVAFPQGGKTYDGTTASSKTPTVGKRDAIRRCVRPRNCARGISPPGLLEPTRLRAKRRASRRGSGAPRTDHRCCRGASG